MAALCFPTAPAKSGGLEFFASCCGGSAPASSSRRGLLVSPPASTGSSMVASCSASSLSIANSRLIFAFRPDPTLLGGFASPRALITSSLTAPSLAAADEEDERVCPPPANPAGGASSDSLRCTKSCRFAPRSSLAWMPSTKAKASTRFDLPLPFGPRMQLNDKNGPTSNRSPYDLKFSRINRWARPMIYACVLVDCSLIKPVPSNFYSSNSF